VTLGEGVIIGVAERRYFAWRQLLKLREDREHFLGFIDCFGRAGIKKEWPGGHSEGNIIKL
jgi:hypothetical protein